MGDFEERLKQTKVSSEGADNAPESMNLEIEKTKPSGLKKIVFFAGGIMVILVMATILITSGIFGGDKISEKQLIVGASFTMEENKSVMLEVEEQEHEIIVENIGEDWAEIVIRSDPMKFKLKVNEVIEIDLDNDGQSDVRIKLFKIQDGKAIIAVKRIDKEACVEDWVCEDWGGCSDGKRIRECFDVNECGSRFFIPFHEQKCLGNNPVEINETENRIKGMEDVVRSKEIDFSDKVQVNSNVSGADGDNYYENETENNDSSQKISLERVDDLTEKEDNFSNKDNSNLSNLDISLVS